ncbi:hydrocephalus-inducing protein-like [Manacus candei]|uniref:hydrocephalus-inducing protein-like n=1 Tax=Manacus candei TaxID=415023 RepID=UPI0022278F50|nr:hydrocephalus-inducing protein-like [Manacus candei]
MPLLLRNRGKVTRLVKVTMNRSPYFKLVGPNGVCHQIPAGSFCTLNILFTPEGNKSLFLQDHFHELVCVCQGETLIVPIRAVGARPVLDFPEQLDFSSCPVNHSTQKTLLVRNTGNLEACYSLSTESPFTVSPATGILDIGEAMQVTVEYHPKEIGHHSTSLSVHYNIVDEDTYTRLLGKAKDFNVGLEKYSLEFDKTYLTLSSQKTMVIHNRTNITARFQWKAFSTEAEEHPQKIRLSLNLPRPPLETARLSVEKRYEELDLYDRELEKATAKIEADPMLFSDDVFTIEPLEGEVGPHSSAEIKVFFKPREAQVYTKVAYCSISGRESRLPLCLTGEGLGPCLRFKFPELDMGKVLVGEAYSYEAILVNTGAINAPFRLIPPTTVHGSCFTFQPRQGIIPRNGILPIQIFFSSSTLGEFEEEFQFNVAECPKPVTLIVRGHVTGLSLHFSTNGLDFNDVSFGFPQTLSCHLINTSVVPITFHLRVPEDGQGQPSLTSFDQVKYNTHPYWEKGTLAPCQEKPMEFTITPSTGTIPAHGFQEIRVTLCSNDVGQYDCDMVVDVDGFGKEVLALRLKARCVVPELCLLTSTLDCGPCSAKVPCQKMLTLVNPSPLPGCYRILPQRNQEATALWYSSPKPCGIIQGHDVLEIPITAEVQAVGAHSIPVDIAVFGKERSPLQMSLMCTGKIPLVYASVNKINFGKIQVIKDTSQTLQLCNQDLIPAAFRVEIGDRCLSIEPREGVVPAKAEVPVVVTANLDDTGRFEGSMKLFIENSLTSVIPIQAVGIGTTITIDKPFAPKLNLEPQFNLLPCILRFKVTNKGRQFQRLFWGTEGFSTFRQRHPLPALSVTKGKNASQSPTTPVFKLRPRNMDLQPGETMELVVEGFSSIVQDVEEKLVCEAIVKPEITKKEIIKTKVTCKFISPSMQISSRAITFHVEKYPDDILTLQYKPLSLKNTCCLPFHLLMDLEQPFLICDANQQPLPAGAQPVKMEAGQELHLYISFNPAYEKDLISWAAKKTMKIRLVEHPYEEEITVQGEVYFPNLCIPTKALDFGCIVSGTEQVRYLEMTNCSPIPAHYHWSFQVDSKKYPTGFIPSPPTLKPQPQMARFGCVECGRYLRRYFRPGSVQKPAKAPEAAQDSSQQSAHYQETEQRCSQQTSKNCVEDSSEESSDWEDSLETEQDSSLQSSDSENCVETEDDSSEESSDSEDSLETEDISPEQSSSEKSLETKQDSCQKSSHSEDSPEAKVPPSTAAGPQSSAETEESGQSEEAKPPGFRAEEVFSVQPVSGVLQPGKSQQVPFTFFGHADIIAHVTALCRVEGGPTYKVELRGETKVLTYHLSVKEINFGLQLFNEVIKAEVTLQNDGKIEFTYVVQSPSTGTADKPLPGVLAVLPNTASIEPGKEQVLKLYYLPGMPGVFCRTFKIKVGHLKPAEISLKGEAVFAGIYLDLPWSIEGSEKYKRLLKQAKEKLKKDKQLKKASLWRKARIRNQVKGPDIVINTWLRMEMDQMLIKEDALELQPTLISRPPEDTVFDNSVPQKLVKVELPEYILDMGTVVQGFSKICTVNITNTWKYPVAVRANGRALRDTGFSIYLEPMESLINGDTIPFQVKFSSANLPVGKVDVLLPIKVEKGPTLHIRLRAIVIQPLLSLSKDRLQFPHVQVGQCWCETVRLYNPFNAPCEWFLSASKPAKKVNKCSKPAVHQKELQAVKDDSQVFQWKAQEGTLYGREWCDLKIQFSPLEEKSYKTELKINVHGSSQLLVLHISGQGLEPRLEFSPTEIKLGAVLPCSPELERTVVVKNPCEFPIEFYSLDFDEEYREEEKILRTLEEFGDQAAVVMPPRAVGEKLPPEVLEYYEKWKKMEALGQEIMSKCKEESGEDNAALQESIELLKDMVDESDGPIRQAIRRYTRPVVEEIKAQMPRGIVIIVYGTPRTGKSRVAAALSKYYGVTRLSLDQVVIKAMSDERSSAGLRARELCIEAARQRRAMREQMPGKKGAEAKKTQPSPGDKTSKKTLSVGHQGPSASKDKASDKPQVASKAVGGCAGGLQAWVSAGQGMSPPGLSPAAASLHCRVVLVSAREEAQIRAQQWELSRAFCRGLFSLPCSTLQMAAISCATAPAPQRLIILTRTGRKEKIRKCLSCVLPKELLVEIISERLQLSDCYRGVVFDGLETLFASSLASSLLCVLKAVSNRPHIHVVNIFQDSEFWKGRRMAAREKKAAKKQQKAREKEEAARRKEKRLWDVDVDEYEALTEKQKALLDYKIEKIKRERRERREQERLAREEEERKKALSKASKKQKKTKSPEVQQKSKKPAAKQQQQETKSADVRKGKTTAAKQQQQETKSADIRKGKTAAAKQQQQETKSADIRKGKTAAAKQQQQETKKPEVRKGKTAAAKQQQQETKIPEVPSKRDMILDLRFNIYESAQKEIRHILSSWDRVQGIMNKSQSSPKHKGEKSSSMSLERPEKKSLEEHGSHKSPQQEGEVRSHGTGVPCLDFHITRRENVFEKILKSKKLPPAKQILDSLGLGPLGPPILPGFLFSVVPYPEEDRVPAAAEDLRHFILVEPESAAAEDDVAPEAEAEDHLKEEEDTSRCNSPQEKRNSPQSPKSLRDHSPETPRSSPESRKSKLQSDSTLERPTRLRKFRWIVPAHGEVELKIRFSTTMPGQFDQMMNFEILGSKRLYQLPCSATALYPSISQNPRLVFPRWRKNKEKEDIIVKEYVMSTKQFYFGPLLCGKSREWYKAQNCPDNSEKLTIFNDSPMEAEVHFSFENDSRGETFLLDPPSMRLQPKEKKKLTIWAYPTSTGLMQDSLICHVKDNAEPVVFRLCCEGVHVKLGVSPQELQFNKLLLHRTDTQTLVLRNDSPLPMAWHLSGLEDLGEDFSVSQGRGIVGPRKDLEVKLNFRAEKIGIINKMIRVEVSDTENILGIVHAETIKVSVEVYDVNLSINMPEGPDGSVDFGTINVFDNKKEVLSLKNKGLYDIEYNFKLTTGSSKKGDLKSHFTVRPQRAVLKASKPPVKVEILFHPMTEMLLKSRPILLCQVFDPQVGGETVATIPVRVSARAVYSKYSIEPASPIDFGTMIKGTKKTQVLTVENKGALNFKFFIHQAPPLQSSQEEESAPSVREKTHSTQAQLTVGMFTVSPCSGSIGPWGKQNITVDCNAGAEGKCEEQVYIDISNRDPKDNPLGIPFTLTAESCFPALVEDVTSIFEKYPIHSNINLHQTLQSVQGNGVFIRDDNTFIFTKVLVGQRATAYFKISNASSIPCNVVLSIKALPGEPHSLISHIFKLDPVEMKLPGLSHGFATVTFTPEEKKDHQCTFTASVVIPKSSSVNTKPQQLTFTISGEGHVPQVTVEYPGLRSKRGNPVLRFRRLLLGDSQALPLVLRNDGVIPTKFTVHIVDDKGVFFMKGRQSSLCAFHIGDMEEDSTGKAKKHPEKPYMLLEHGQSAEFDVFFKPTLAQHLEGKIRVPLSGNNEINIELVGEGYDDDFTFDNLPGLAEDSEKSNAEGSLEDDIIEAIRANHIEFGDCAVRELCEKTFTVTNRSKEVMRFEWLADALFQFSPKVGHLQPGCAKDIRVTLKSKVPVTIKRHSVNCKVDKIKYQLPPEEVYNWDDGMYTEKWEDTNERLPGARWPIKEKVAKAVLEPTHTVLEKSSREVELFLSAEVDYAKFKLDTVEVHLKQTEPFQTEISTFQMSNTGKVALKYSWEVDLEQERPSKRSGKPYSVTLMRYFLSSATVDHWFEHRPSRVHWASPLESTRPQSSLPHSTQPTPSRRRSSQMTCLTKHVSSSMELYPDDFDDPPLFSVEPDCGTIPAGQTQIFQVKFCPTRVGEFKAEMLCSIPNLKPSQKSPSVFVMGKGYLRKADLKRSTSLQKGETQSSKPKKKVQQSAKPE